MAGPPSGQLLDQVRHHLGDDLDAPAALQAVDRWVEQARHGGEDEAAPGVVAELVDALLGVRL